jgi:hypothetical protein
MSMIRTKTQCPWYAPVEIQAAWDSWTEATRTMWRNQNPPGTKTFSTPKDASVPEAGTYGKTATGKIAPVLVEKHVTEWDRDMELDGKIIPAKRIRYAVLELIGKSKWYAENMSNGLVERMLAKIIADSTPGWEPLEADPLFGVTKYKNEDEELELATIRRAPKNEEERIKIRDKFGVNYKTIKFLVKKDCSKCKGRGTYSVSAYPGDPVYGRLTETVECSCSYE